MTASAGKLYRVASLCSAVEPNHGYWPVGVGAKIVCGEAFAFVAPVRTNNGIGLFGHFTTPQKIRKGNAPAVFKTARAVNTKAMIMFGHPALLQKEAMAAKASALAKYNMIPFPSMS